MLNFFKKFGPTLMTIATAAAGMMSSTVQGAVSAHPTVTIVISAAIALLHALLPSIVA